MKKGKILLVDDDPDILEIISYNLKKENYQISIADNGKKAISLAQKIHPSLIILDIMMPEMDGIETCQRMREIPSLKNTLIIFLTAKNEDYSQIKGLDIGADDYIVKLIKPRVLVSKIKALLRRHHALRKTIIQASGILIDREKYIVEQKGNKIELPKKEFELLSLLMSNVGKVCDRNLIMSEIWGGDVIVGDRTIDVHIRKLREKLGNELIKTIKGVGYKFEDQ